MVAPLLRSLFPNRFAHICSGYQQVCAQVRWGGRGSTDEKNAVQTTSEAIQRLHDTKPSLRCDIMSTGGFRVSAEAPVVPSATALSGAVSYDSVGDSHKASAAMFVDAESALEVPSGRDPALHLLDELRAFRLLAQPRRHRMLIDAVGYLQPEATANVDGAGYQLLPNGARACCAATTRAWQNASSSSGRGGSSALLRVLQCHAPGHGRREHGFCEAHFA